MTEPSGAHPPRSSQPWLHLLEVAVHGTVTCLSHPSGDVDASSHDGAATGLFVDDRRILDHLVLTVDAVRPVPVVAASAGPTTECLLLARNVGDPGPDRLAQRCESTTVGTATSEVDLSASRSCSRR